MALSRIRDFFGELSTFLKLQDMLKGVTFYAEDDFSYLTMAGYVDGLLAAGDEVVYLTSDLRDPLFDASIPHLHVLGVKTLLAPTLGKCRAPILVTTMPDLGSLHIARPPESTRLVYVFHALVSIMRSYREDSFDHYDDFFCCGAYHVEELRRRFELIKKPCPQLHEVGYFKLDRMHEHFLKHKKLQQERPTVLLAPSWHPGNLFESVGPSIVRSLLEHDFQVAVRPHPAFFSSIYPKGRAMIAHFKETFGDHPHFVLDTTMRSELYFYEADLLITDWSGSAYEYAFATERPVLFFDTPAKVRNEKWTDYGIVPFEVSMRNEVGQVLTSSHQDRTVALVNEMIEEAPLYREEIRAVRDRQVFNFRKSAEVGTAILRDLLSQTRS